MKNFLTTFFSTFYSIFRVIQIPLSYSVAEPAKNAAKKTVISFMLAIGALCMANIIESQFLDVCRALRSPNVVTCGNTTWVRTMPLPSPVLKYVFGIAWIFMAFIAIRMWILMIKHFFSIYDLIQIPMKVESFNSNHGNTLKEFMRKIRYEPFENIAYFECHGYKLREFTNFATDFAATHWKCIGQMSRQGYLVSVHNHPRSINPLSSLDVKHMIVCDIDVEMVVTRSYVYSLELPNNRLLRQDLDADMIKAEYEQLLEAIPCVGKGKIAAQKQIAALATLAQKYHMELGVYQNWQSAYAAITAKYPFSCDTATNHELNATKATQ